MASVSRGWRNGWSLLMPALLAIGGLILGILATQFCSRQAVREPCHTSVVFFSSFALVASVVIPWLYMAWRRWATRQRVVGIAVAALTSGLVYFGLNWFELLQASWSEAW